MFVEVHLRNLKKSHRLLKLQHYITVMSIFLVTIVTVTVETLIKIYICIIHTEAN
jgi:hypothetical protein